MAGSKADGTLVVHRGITLPIQSMDWRNLTVSTKEDCLGGLTTGKWADLAIFDRDLSQIPADEWLEARVEMTIVDGEIVYGR